MQKKYQTKLILHDYFFTAIIAIFLFALLQMKSGFASASFERKAIRIVGSSTLYPFLATVAESFGRNTEFRTPIIESNGTGGGFKLFCAGIGQNHPDISNASRKITDSESELCNKNNIHQPTQIKIGYDGIVLATSLDSYKQNQFSLTKEEIFLALAKDIPDKTGKKLVANPNKYWSDINPSLPKQRILVYGPPQTSGTRDAFVEMAIFGACEQNSAFIKQYPEKKSRAYACKNLRSDGGFIEAGENDNLIVQKLRNNLGALGIFGFSFLEENKELIKSVKIDGVEPTFNNITNNSYELSRPLFIYVKKEHESLVKGLVEFKFELINSAMGPEGYLVQKGLIPLNMNEYNFLHEDHFQVN